MTVIAVAGGTGTIGAPIVARIRDLGHEARELSRRTGVDLATGTGLDLRGVDAVIDAIGVDTISAKRAVDFFSTTSGALLRAGADAGVRHHLALSIVGADAAPHGYYAGKAAQERIVRSGTVPWTIARATQFHEFAAQMLRRGAVGPVALIPRTRAQPVSSRDLATVLVDLALGEPLRDAIEIAGPREERVVEMARAYAAATGRRGPILEIPFPGAFGRALADGTLLPGADARILPESFADWLARIRS